MDPADIPVPRLLLYTRSFHRWALLTGWAVARVYGTAQAYRVPVRGTPGSHFGGSTAPIPFFGQNGHIAMTAFVINLIIAVVLTLFRAARLPPGAGETAAHHYLADTGEVVVCRCGRSEGETDDVRSRRRRLRCHDPFAC